MRGLILYPLFAAAIVLTGCASPGGGSSTVTADAVAKYQAIANGLLSIAGQEAQIAGAPAEMVARITADAQLARAAIDQLSVGLSAVAAQPTVQAVEAKVDDLLTVLGGLNLPPQAQQLVLALRVLLPVAEAAISPSSVTAPVAGAAPGSMTPARAQAVLASAPVPHG